MKRFNPPRNWPAPPFGWEPPPDWQPDPTWGPPPPGHQFWIEVPDQNASMEQRGKAITITALILAGVALILCWVPIVNNAVFVLGLIAVVLAVIALVMTRRGSSMMKGMAVASLAVGALSIIGVLATQAIYSSMLDGISDAVSGRDADEPGTPLPRSLLPPDHLKRPRQAPVQWPGQRASHCLWVRPPPSGRNTRWLSRR